MSLQTAIKREVFQREAREGVLAQNWDKYDYFLFEGGRNGAKSQTIARTLLHIASIETLRIFCGREIQATIEESVYTLFKNIIVELELPFHILKRSITEDLSLTEFKFKGFREQGRFNVQGLEDVDVLWIDEAQAITKETLKIIVPTIRKEGSKVIFSMNRFLEKDPVFDKFNKGNGRKDTLHVHMNYLDNPYLSQKMITEANECKQKDPDEYMHVWMGQPQLESNASCALSLKKLREAVDRDVIAEGGLVVGVDVARFGDDRSVMYKRRGFKTIGYKVYTSKDLQNTGDNKSGLVKLADYCEEFVEFNKKAVFNIDDSGVGGGLTDIMRQRGYTVNAINNGGVPKEREINKRLNRGKTPNHPDYIYDKYDNVITEMFFEFADIIDKVSIPDNYDLLYELSSRRYSYTKDQKKIMEKKKDFKKRLLRSPDEGDAYLLCYYSPPIAPTLHFMVV